MNASRKLCPYCGAEIDPMAKQCRTCGVWFDDCSLESQGEIALRQEGMTEIAAENAATVSTPVKEGVYVENPFVDTDSTENVSYLDGQWFDGDGKLIGWDERHSQSLLKAYGYFPFFKMDYIFNFNTPISRRAYWWSYLYSVLWMTLLLTLLAVFDCFSGDFKDLIGFKTSYQVKSTIALIIGAVMTIGFLIGSVSLISRRLADIEKSPWWTLIGLIPIIGPIWLIVLLCKKGKTINSFNPGKFIPAVDITAFLLILGSLVVLDNLIPDEYVTNSVDQEEIGTYYADEDEKATKEVEEEKSYSLQSDVVDVDFDFEGTVDTYDIRGHLVGDGHGNLEGVYYYVKEDGTRKSKNLTLDGEFDEETGEFILGEYYNDELIGKFEGQYFKGLYYGTYTNLSSGNTMEFSFSGFGTEDYTD